MNYTSFLAPNSLAIFLLHGVIEENSTEVRNYTRKHIVLDEFKVFVQGLKQSGKALSMDEVIEHIRAKEQFPDNSFALTFDDGFENNLSVAAPVLTEENIPATVYITSDFIASNRMSWIDRIEAVVEEAPVGDLSLPWGAGGFSSDADSKKAFLETVRQHLKNNRELDQDKEATEIQAQLDFEPFWQSHHPLDLKMSWQQVRELAENPLFTIGGHSHSHGILSFLSDKQVEREIDLSLELIESNTGIRCHHYSYPEGLSHCYSQREIDLLKKRGIQCSPSAEHGTNTEESDLFHLKRIFVV